MSGDHNRYCSANQPPEMVGWADKYDIDREGHDFWVSRQQPAKNGVPLYTAPQPAGLNLNCKSVQKRLAEQWGYVLAQKGETNEQR